MERLRAVARVRSGRAVTRAVFGPGDAVQLRGEGPVMHVIALHAPPRAAAAGMCYCNWVDATGILCHATFEQHHLTRAAPPLASEVAAD